MVALAPEITAVTAISAPTLVDRATGVILFPFILLGHRGESDVELLPVPVERLFGAVMALEWRLLRIGVSLPFGGSILATR